MLTVSLLVRQIWEETQYPGAIPLVGHTGYTIKPTYIRLEQGFLSKADLTDLHAWYEDTFHLNVSEHTDECVVLDGTIKRFVLVRTTFVSMCQSPRGQEIFITRLLSMP